MVAVRNFLDQLLDGSSKKRLRSECTLKIGSISDDPAPLGTEEDYNAAHDELILQLSKVGRTTEDSGELADFSLDRYVGDRSYIGVVCDRTSARIILAVRAAQASFRQPYPVHLDCEDAIIAILPTGEVIGDVEDDEGEKVLASFGFPT